MSNVKFGVLDGREDGSGGMTISGVSSPGNFGAGRSDSNLVGNAAGGIVSGLVADASCTGSIAGAARAIAASAGGAESGAGTLSGAAGSSPIRCREGTSGIISVTQSAGDERTAPQIRRVVHLTSAGIQLDQAQLLLNGTPYSEDACPPGRDLR